MAKSTILRVAVDTVGCSQQLDKTYTPLCFVDKERKKTKPMLVVAVCPISTFPFQLFSLIKLQQWGKHVRNAFLFLDTI